MEWMCLVIKGRCGDFEMKMVCVWVKGSILDSYIIYGEDKGM